MRVGLWLSLGGGGLGGFKTPGARADQNPESPPPHASGRRGRGASRGAGLCAETGVPGAGNEAGGRPPRAAGCRGRSRSGQKAPGRQCLRVRRAGGFLVRGWETSPDETRPVTRPQAPGQGVCVTRAAPRVGVWPEQSRRPCSQGPCRPRPALTLGKGPPLRQGARPGPRCTWWAPSPLP